ncbi:MAG: phasin family protein [Alphaproteobacteria bacterium]|nr:phasin family protein [Alphaproteobacteria bacterium]MBU0859930.1 phasin family protein [Alphaproteobacteria bacterium]
MTTKSTDKNSGKNAADKAHKAAPAGRKESVETTEKVARFADFQALKDVQPTQAMETIMTKSKEQMEKLSNEAAAVSKDHVEALMKSGSIFMKGYEDIMKTYMGLAQKTAEKNGEAFKTLLSCKTVNEFAEVQNRLAQQGFDDMMTGATKLSELTVKLASEGFAPINDQMSKSIKKASDAMAA